MTFSKRSSSNGNDHKARRMGKHVFGVIGLLLLVLAAYSVTWRDTVPLIVVKIVYYASAILAMPSFMIWIILMIRPIFQPDAPVKQEDETNETDMI